MGASQRMVRRDVLAQLSAKSRIGGRNPISTLCTLTDSNSVEGKRMVEKAVQDLRAEGLAQVKMKGGMIIEILHRQPREHRDRTERSAQAKREDMFAKGVPAYLPDSMCSPVVVTHASLKNSAEVQTDAETGLDSEWDPEGSLVNNLNVCLRALRQMANEKGEAPATSVRDVLFMVQGMTESTIRTAMKYLQGMGFYLTVRSGYQQSSYTVELEAVVTQDRLNQYRLSQRTKASVVTAEPSDVEPLAVEVVAVETSDILVMHGEADPMVRLAEIIEQLEAENARLHVVVESQQASIIELSDRSTRQQDALAEVTEERDELRRQLDAERTMSKPLDDKVAAILARHQRS